MTGDQQITIRLQADEELKARALELAAKLQAM
jgi:hypothetical protein